jgi:hypothetical protein
VYLPYVFAGIVAPQSSGEIKEKGSSPDKEPSFVVFWFTMKTQAGLPRFFPAGTGKSSLVGRSARSCARLKTFYAAEA